MRPEVRRPKLGGGSFGERPKIAEVSTRADFYMVVMNGWVVPYANYILAGKAGVLRNTDSLGLHEVESRARLRSCWH